MTPAWLALLVATAAARASDLGDCQARIAAQAADREAWRCAYLHGRRTGEWDAAEAVLRNGTVRDPENGHAWLNLGHVHSDRGLPGARPLYDTALAAYAAKGDATGQVQARVARANFGSHSGAPAGEVRADLDAAGAIAVASGEAELMATADASLARHLWRTGEDYALGLSLVRRARDRAFPDGPYQLQLTVLHVQAGIARETGNLDEAWAASRAMAELAAGAGDRYVEATARLNAADFALQNPDRVPPGEANFQARAGLAAAEASGNDYMLAGSRCVQARALDLAAEPGSAPLWRACIDGFAALDDPLSETLGALGLAGSLARTDSAAALDAAVRASDRARASGEGLAIAQAGQIQAWLTWRTGGEAAGIAADAEHLAEVERLLGAQSDPVTRAELASTLGASFHGAAARLASAGDLDGALSTGERMRARSLRDALRDIAPPPEDSGGGTGDPLGLDAPIARLAEAQGALNEGEVLVVFHVPAQSQLTPEATPTPFALVVTRAGARRVALPDRSLLEVAVPTFAGLVQAGDPLADDAGARLFAGLLAPAWAEGPPSRLVVVLDGPMQELPLAALRPRRDAPPLGTSVPIAVAASVTTWLAQGRLPAAEGPPLVLADPEPPRGVAGAWPRLPAARVEGTEVARALGVTSGPLIGPAAHSEVLSGLSKAPRVLHVAAHARVEGDDPRRHLLLLADGPGGASGALSPGMLGTLPLRGSVVVLSACRGATGRVLEGDGVEGLTRALLAAGAAAVVSSIWPVEDEEAAALFPDFARALAAGASADEALSRTQALAAKRGQGTAWAAFRVVGRGDVRVAPPSGAQCAAVGAVPVSLPLPLLALILRRRRHRRATR